MSTPLSPSLASQCSALTDSWKRHPFYKDSVVLAVDVGLEGIGVCVRRGTEILYAKTWMLPLPDAAPLEGRRLLRCARHCRANRKTRLHRLRLLFEKHGLPWLDDESPARRRSDPFILRYRAVASANGLASKEALSIAIQHCVAHRGHDYQYFSDEGAYPWGDSVDFKKVIGAMANLRLTSTEAEQALRDAGMFEWKPEEFDQFATLVREKTVGPEFIAQHLAEHAKGSKNHVRARAKGQAFPRKLVAAHLETILQRHAHLIENFDDFRNALFRENKTPEDRRESIFYFHRKTPSEMRAHFEKKRARCPYSAWLGLGEACTEPRGNPDIRRWSLLEFATMRDVEMQAKKTPRGQIPIRWRVSVPPDLIQRLLEWQSENPACRKASDISAIKAEFCQRLEAAHAAKVAPEGGKAGSELNKHFFTVLRDLLAPSISTASRNAPMSAQAASCLFQRATAQGFQRDSVRQCLASVNPGASTPSLYDFRRQPMADLHGIYPQVEFLLGQRVKKALTRPRNGVPKKRGELATKGKLPRLFDELLGEGAVPDYCIIEVAKDLPRNQKQKKEREELIQANRGRREQLIVKYAAYLPQSAPVTGSMKRRIELFEQQGGVCPFTGRPLGQNPLSDDLDVEHLFPASRGGLTVDENLVLTFSSVNRSEKKDHTPREYAKRAGVAFDVMESYTAPMRWGQFKRSIFAWAADETIPEFGNTTRTAQLARQLIAEVGNWMKCTSDSHAERIGLPSGFQTAACRRSWGLPEKNREDLTHHLVDALILAHIPPREGQNYVQSGGIFVPLVDSARGRTTLGVLPLGPSPHTVAQLSAEDSLVCPIERHRSSSHSRPLHDKTLLRVLPDGKLAYRTSFPPKETLDAPQLRALLVSMGVPSTYRDREGNERPLIPSMGALESWLATPGDDPLRLLNGTPVRNIWKEGKKGSLISDPTGFHARWNSDGQLVGVKSVIQGRWKSLELWRGWNSKKGRWEYYKKLIPSAAVFGALRSLGYSWKKKNRKGWREGAPADSQPLKRTLGGELPPYARPAVHPESKKPMVFEAGTTLRVPINQAGKLAKRGEAPHRFTWVEIGAVMAEGGGRLRFLSLFTGDKVGEPMTPDDFAFFAGLPPADDSSSYPTQRQPGPPPPRGETGFRLE